MKILVSDDFNLGVRELHDLEMLLMGAFAPLSGFMGKEDYFSCLNNMRLVSGEIWPIPIVLAIPKQCTKEDGEGSIGRVLKLRDTTNTILAELRITDIYEPDLELEMLKVLGSTDENHPWAAYLKSNHVNCYYVGGPLTPAHPIIHFDFVENRLSAAEVRKILKAKQYPAVVGFQTRNPMHRSHFELTKQALREVSEDVGDNAALLLSPVVGPTQAGDIDYRVRVRCYKQLLPHYSEAVELVLLPLSMRMAGPREAVWHALIRKNYGCTHFIVGRDHAGPSAKKSDGSPFYDMYAAHVLLKSVQNEIGIKPIFGLDMVYAGDQIGFVPSDKISPGVIAKSISGSEFRRRLESREEIPEWFSFKNVVQELHKFYKPNHQRGFCVYFSGLPCSGKSTLANSLESSLLERASESRRVTLLDADIIRTHLSRGLGFSKPDRQVNVRRIGYVASEIVKHGGICIAANIAPYEEDRMWNRSLITSTGGGYVEVHVSTPLEVCEKRDIKELYRKARLGEIKHFTGVSDPYEIPSKPELNVNSTDDIVGKVGQVVEYLKSQQWII